MNFEIKKNTLVIKENEKSLNIDFFANESIRIYKKKNKCDLIELNYAKKTCNFEVVNSENGLVVNFKNTKLIVKNVDAIEIIKNNKSITTISFNTLFDEYEKREYYNVTFDINSKDNVFGLGDKMSPMDKKGYFFASHNTDDPSHQDELFPSLYKSINYLLLRLNAEYIGVFCPSTYRYTYDICKTNLKKMTINNFEEEQDLFIFLADKISKITSSYSDLVGHPYFIRLKMFGNNQSRWSYENEKMVRDIFENFKKYDIPLDYIHLDIHYMDGYRDFTIDKTRFPNMKGLSDELKKGGVELVAINDAAIKEDRNFDLYNYLEENELFSKDTEGKTYINAVWPGDSGFPNYFKEECKKYFEDYAHKFIHEHGISGIWCDMNEPASFNGPLPDDVDFSYRRRKLDHKEAHNVYAEHMVRSFVNTFRKDNVRPYLFSRAAFATTSKYAFIWNGDNVSLWHHLRYSIPQNLSLAISNLGFNGCDVGGFGGDCNKELLIRWTEANIFMPFFRNHSSINTRAQEPYAFDDETIDIYRKYINLRYKFVPYLYNEAQKMSEKGIPMIRPIFFDNQDDIEALKIGDEYMVGEDLLVAPVLDKSQTVRAVYLPKGEWVDPETGIIYKGKKYHILNKNLAELAYFVRKNKIIPMYNGLKTLDKSNIKELTLTLYGTKGSAKIYDDDGHTLDYEKGIYNVYDVSIADGKITLKFTHNNYKTSYENLIIETNGKKYKLPFREFNKEDLKSYEIK